MQFFIILLLLGSQMILIRSRALSMVEGNDSENADAEYEGNEADDANADEYREEQESAIDEAQQKSHKDIVREFNEQGDSRDFEAPDQQSTHDKYRYETFSGNNPGSREKRLRHESAELNTENEKDYSAEKQFPRNSQQIGARNELYSHSSDNQKKLPQSELSLNGRSVNTHPDYGELLFKMKPALASRQQNNLGDEANDQSRLIKQYNPMHSKNIEQENENTFNYERNRRHAENVNDQKVTDSTRLPNDKEEINLTNENSENAIVKNIKRISEQELEELLNSLPEDKKALLKKIMDKREITKKAGAIDENSYLEGGQADTSKLEGGYSVYFTESSMTSDTPETSKQPESSDSLSSKTPESESGSKESGSKSEVTNISEIKNEDPAVQKESEITDGKNYVNINSDSEEISKIENKREANNKELANEKWLEDSKNQEYQLEAKDSDYSGNQEDLCSENDDWVNEPQESNARGETFKRDVSQNDLLELQECVKSLKDSFPASDSYEDNILESEMAPLIRVKRTEKEHHTNKCDTLPSSNDEVHFSPGVDSEDCENKEKSEFNDGVFTRGSDTLRKYQGDKTNKGPLLVNSDTACQFSQFRKRDLPLNSLVISESQEKDKASLGSDTDTVLSGGEEVDENIMYNSGLRAKRSIESSYANPDKTHLNRSGRTAGPINVDDVPDNSINVSQYQNDEAFGPVALNSEGDLGRFKRVRQVEQDSQK